MLTQQTSSGGKEALLLLLLLLLLLCLLTQQTFGDGLQGVLTHQRDVVEKDIEDGVVPEDLGRAVQVVKEIPLQQHGKHLLRGTGGDGFLNGGPSLGCGGLGGGHGRLVSLAHRLFHVLSRVANMLRTEEGGREGGREGHTSGDSLP